MKERQQRILEMLQQRGGLRMQELEEALRYSRSTIRRDVLALEALGALTHRQGRVYPVSSSGKEKHYNLRRLEHLPEKAAMAALALPFIEDGMSLFLDASTTVQQLCPLLARFQNLTILTNSLDTARIAAGLPGADLFFPGGYYRADTGCILGEPAIEYIQKFRMDLCVLSCYGLDKDGAYDASTQHSYLKQAMLDHADRAILLCAGYKAGHRYKYRLAPFSRFDAWICDVPPPLPLREAAQAAGCRTVFGPEPEGSGR